MDKFGNKYDGKYMCVVFPRYTEVVFKEKVKKSENTIMTNVGKALYSIAKGNFERKPNMNHCGWLKHKDSRCPFYEEHCKEWLENEEYIKKFDNDKTETETETDEWNEEDWYEEEEKDKPYIDLSEGSWDSTKEAGLE